MKATIFLSRRAGLLAVLWAALLVLSGCTTPEPFNKQADQYQAAFSKRGQRYTYILQFDVAGRLVNFNTLFQAINDISNSASLKTNGGPITNILVISYGWNHDLDAFEADYADLLSNYDGYIKTAGQTLGPGQPVGPAAVICVSWPSGYSMMGKSLTDLMPGTTLPRTLTAPLDAAFPLSVWAKTSLADRIGYGDLPQALGYLYSHAYGGEFQPNIFLVGHSFGCRVLSGVIRRHPPSNLLAVSHAVKFFTHTNQSETVRANVEGFRQRIKGAILIQPAMANANLPGADDCANFPLLVTQSHYDHLNGVLYPIASIPFNGYWSTEMDTRFARSIYRRPWNDEAQPAPGWWLYVKQLGFETLRIPLSVVDSAELLPWSYARGQFWEFGRGNWNWQTNYLTSTLAQVPLVKIPVQLTLNSGYHKGLFDVGRWHESAGRISFDSANILSAASTLDSTTPPTGLTIKTNGVQFVNCDDLISHSIVSKKIDYRNPLWNYTLGQIDPVGSHDDYEPPAGSSAHPEIFDWIHFLLHESVLGVPAAVGQ
jgi:hypothetical protein